MTFDSAMFASLAEAWQGKLSLYAFIGIMAISLIGGKLLLLVPTFREAAAINKQNYAEKRLCCVIARGGFLRGI